MDEDRGLGRTARQLKSAPVGALYICPNHQFISYAKQLAKHLRCGELHFAAREDLETDKFRGLEWPAIVIDHAVTLTEPQRCGLSYLGPFVGRRSA